MERAHDTKVASKVQDGQYGKYTLVNLKFAVYCIKVVLPSTSFRISS